MDLSKYDHLFASILNEERQIYPFLDAVFGFLWRRSDFFAIQKDGGKIGFPVGGAEKIVWSILKKWQNVDLGACAAPPKIRQDNSDTGFTDCVVKEEVVLTSEENLPPPKQNEQLEPCLKDNNNQTVNSRNVPNSSDTYNGADRGTYRWCQTISDLEVQVPVASHVMKSKDVNITLTDRKIDVKTVDDSDKSKWNTAVEGEFCFKLNKDDCVWSLLPGQQITVHCEKCEERWWDGLLKNEPKLDKTHIDTSRPMTDLSEEEQMKIEEMMWNEERRKQGLKTKEQEKAERILKDAWNAEGSPFKGTEFDPTVLDFNPSST